MNSRIGPHASAIGAAFTGVALLLVLLLSGCESESDVLQPQTDIQANAQPETTSPPDDGPELPGQEQESEQSATLYTTPTEPSKRQPVSCRMGDLDLSYPETGVARADLEAMSECLRAAAQRGEVIALTGQLVADGALIEAGDASIHWPFSDSDEEHLSISVFDDRIIFDDRCDGRLELVSGVLRVAAHGYCGLGGLNWSDARVLQPDFTIFVIGQQFVADGEDGWYHINFYIPRIELTSRGPGVWVTAEEDPPGPEGGSTHVLRLPLAGNDDELQGYYAADWLNRVWYSLISFSFAESAYEFFPDSEAYWSVMKAWIYAILNDLFRDRDDRPELDLVVREHGLMLSDESAYFATEGDAFLTLNEVARVVAGERQGYSPTFTATLLALWERFVPGFDLDAAEYAAEWHRVKVGEPVEVNPISERTAAVFDVLGQKAPDAPSDYEPIDPEDLHLSIVLEVGREDYVVVVSSDISPGCGAQYDSDGSFSGWYMNPIGEFTVNAGGFWNGLRLSQFSSARTSEGGMLVTGTPTVPGRVRVRVLSYCDVDDDEEPRLVGYSEVIVVDPNDDE